MQTYEYKHVDDVSQGNAYSISESDFAAFAADGWRVVSAGWDGNRLMAVLLERPVSPPPSAQADSGEGKGEA
jgi:hypothetical protein